MFWDTLCCLCGSCVLMMRYLFYFNNKWLLRLLDQLNLQVYTADLHPWMSWIYSLQLVRWNMSFSNLMTGTDTKKVNYLRYPVAVSYHILSVNCWVFPWRRFPVIWKQAFGSQLHPRSPLRTRLLESCKGRREEGGWKQTMPCTVVYSADCMHGNVV